MCGTGLEIAAVAIAAAGAGASYYQTDQNAKKQTAMVEDGYAQERRAILQQFDQINQTAQAEQSERHKEALQDEALLRAIGAESGLWGATNNRIEQEAANNAAQDMATIESNRQRQAEQAHTQGGARQSQAGAQLAGIRRPSALGTGLQIAGAATRVMKPDGGVTKPAGWDSSFDNPKDYG